MLGRTDSRRRLLAILIMFAVAGASLVGRLAWWQVVRGADLAAEPEPARVYPLTGGSPNSTLGASLLGFVNRDGQGQYGVESFYQSQLAGQPKVVVAERDANGDPVPGSIVVESTGVPGSDLRL